MLTDTQRKHIQKFHIPIDVYCPGTYWIVSLDCESMMPTDEELAQIKSYIEYSVRRTYQEYWVDVILNKPLSACSGHNTLILRKGSPLLPAVQGWFYRKMFWRGGAVYWPVIGAEYKDRGLVEIFDKYEDFSSESWTEWKNSHPDIFPVPV